MNKQELPLEMMPPVPGWYDNAVDEAIQWRNSVVKPKNNYFSDKIKKIVSKFSDLKKEVVMEEKNNDDYLVQIINNSNAKNLDVNPKPTLIKGELVYQYPEVEKNMGVKSAILSLKLYAQTINDKYNPNSNEGISNLKLLETDISNLIESDESLQNQIGNLLRA
ncbi:hypothetical protein K9L67_05905 [Candidatus Woesearchaeota archaeon]|nr:hypothetical protein [Candidatus Woesearchaeota archaeon]MCF7901728.1 hypothetical protein [Candidatus Woesearchaeota archaeon]MCF8014076.1 hypothetical protein [Candidatus Woesearchaeota archaeon]